MVDNPDSYTSTAGYVLGGAGLLSMAWGYWVNRRVRNAQASATEADATGKTGLIDALEARIAASESRQNSQDSRIQELEGRIAVEIDLRLKIQAESHAAGLKHSTENYQLRLRVTELEYAIRALGGTVPVGPA